MQTFILKVLLYKHNKQKTIHALFAKVCYSLANQVDVNLPSSSFWNNVK